MTEDYLKEVFRRLTLGVKNEDVPFLVEAYTKTGHMLAEAKAEAEDAAAVRKHELAQEYLKAKQSSEKVSDAVANNHAQVATFGLARQEIAAQRRVHKLSNLRESVYQAMSMLKSGAITVWTEDE